MDAPLFYVQPEHVDGDVVELPSEEAHHTQKVLRLKAGALVILIDGLGSAWRAELTTVSPKRVIARRLAEIRGFGEPRVKLTLAAGLSTASKFDSVVQRGTELGVSRFVPLLTEKSKVALEDPRRARTRAQRLEKVARAAAKQCRRSYFPQLALPVRFDDFLGQLDPDDFKLVFHPGKGSVPLRTMDFPPNPPRVLVVVGAEAGFSEEEIDAAVRAGLKPVSLGSRILRTETAGPAVAALVMERLGELS